MYRGLAPHKIVPMPGTHKRMQLTVISVIFFAEAKKLPLITSADAGVIAFCESM